MNVDERENSSNKENNERHSMNDCKQLVSK